MNENEEFTHVQRRLCAVIAKSEWTSSRMRMQKSGEELRESRAKSHRSANQFLQDLLEKRTDSDLMDDNGAVDRYHKFVKYKSGFQDDPNSTLDEFDRRLRDLNNNRRNQTKKLHQQNSNIISEKKLQPVTYSLQPTNEIQNDKKDIVQQVQIEERPKPSRILPSISSIPATSTPNDTTNELTTSVFHDDDIQDFSHLPSENLSFIDSQLNHIESPIHEYRSVSVEKTETFNSSTSSLNHSLTQTLYTPKVRRSDGTEIIPPSSPKTSLPRASSNILLFNHCHFPRSLTSHGKLTTSAISKRQLPSLPIVQPSEQNQFHTDQLYDLFDHLDQDFTQKLDQLTSSTILHHPPNEINQTENSSLIHTDNEEEDDDEEKETILPDLFHQPISTTQEKLFYSTSIIHLDNPKNISLYTMTLSTVQLSASILLPYSILNGRRPLLKSSNPTYFKQIHSKQKKSTYDVTAIESNLNIPQLEQNDILLKINSQSIWGMPTNAVEDILKRCNHCSITIARLCQPFI